MSSAAAEELLVSEVNKVNVLSMSLKLLKMQLVLLLGVRESSTFWSSLMAMSHMGLFTCLVGTPNASGSSHCKLCSL